MNPPDAAAEPSARPRPAALCGVSGSAVDDADSEAAPEDASGLGSSGASSDERLPRFSRAERALHWATAGLVLTAALTGMILYVDDLSVLVGRRTLVKTVHVYAGLAMPFPLLAGYAGRWRVEVRRDIRTLARWSPADKTWLWSRGRRATDKVGKFNAGQKTNAAFVAGLIPVMLASGYIMRWFDPFPIEIRRGATFVHDWTAIVAWVVITGHIYMALSRPATLRAMVSGWMPARWARRHHPLWVEQVEQVEQTGPAQAAGAIADSR